MNYSGRVATLNSSAYANMATTTTATTSPRSQNGHRPPASLPESPENPPTIARPTITRSDVGYLVSVK